jgi:hypothetical protein
MAVKKNTEAVEAVETVQEKTKVVMYSKKALIKKYVRFTDLLEVLLEDGKKYSIDEVEKMIRGDK